MTTGPADQARAELVAIVKRSQRLGFCRWRVATALGASQHERALIDEQTAAEPGPDHRQELVDVSQLVSGLHGLRAADPR